MHIAPHFQVLIIVSLIEDDDVIFTSLDKIFVNIRHFAKCPDICNFMSFRAWVGYILNISFIRDQITIICRNLMSIILWIKTYIINSDKSYAGDCYWGDNVLFTFAKGRNFWYNLLFSQHLFKIKAINFNSIFCIKI